MFYFLLLWGYWSFATFSFTVRHSPNDQKSLSSTSFFVTLPPNMCLWSAHVVTSNITSESSLVWDFYWRANWVFKARWPALYKYRLQGRTWNTWNACVKKHVSKFICHERGTEKTSESTVRQKKEKNSRPCLRFIVMTVLMTCEILRGK